MPSNQTGGTNPFKIYNGYYKLTNLNANIALANPYVLLTTNCFVIFLTNIQMTGNIANTGTLFTIPPECLDGIGTIRIPVVYYENSTGTNTTRYLTINPTTGVCRVYGGAVEAGYIYTEGQSYNIVRKYYNNLDNYQ